jgi:hypothetical protein
VTLQGPANLGANLRARELSEGFLKNLVDNNTKYTWCYWVGDVCSRSGRDLIIKLSAVIGRPRPCLHIKDFMHHEGRLAVGRSEKDFIKLEGVAAGVGEEGGGAGRTVLASVIRKF